MGEVHEAEDLSLGTAVAVKTIRPELAARDLVMERFRREILLARRVTHPNVCRIFDLGRQESPPGSGPDVTFLTMELLGGETLHHRLRSGGPMSPEEAPPPAAQMGAGPGAGPPGRAARPPLPPPHRRLRPPRA